MTTPPSREEEQVMPAGDQEEEEDHGVRAGERWVCVMHAFVAVVAEEGEGSGDGCLVGSFRVKYMMLALYYSQYPHPICHTPNRDVMIIGYG
jgi:hypothetical protein